MEEECNEKVNFEKRNESTAYFPFILDNENSEMTDDLKENNKELELNKKIKNSKNENAEKSRTIENIKGRKEIQYILHPQMQFKKKSSELFEQAISEKNKVMNNSNSQIASSTFDTQINNFQVPADMFSKIFPINLNDPNIAKIQLMYL